MQTSDLNTIFSSGSEEWYTPKKIIDPVLEMFGTIDLDPCSDPEFNVPASNYYLPVDDGLAKPWFGKVYANPPYGRTVGLWASKIASEYECGNAAEIIALIHARTDTKWFRSLQEYPKCFIYGRLTFSRHKHPAPFPSVVFYLGKNVTDFKRVFGKLGGIYTYLA